ncbi:MAG: RsmD family RNA methyltransferase [Pirellulales bacterium]|nr:RsmD family RNA methyltransferase [Pirellulales bacterium]
MPRRPGHQPDDSARRHPPGRPRKPAEQLPKPPRKAIVGLRIIGGRFRGRRLTYHGAPDTRPMKDRVREAVFNLIWPAAEGAVAIDLFAGTGALGLEALSRGAVAAWLIEAHRAAASAIRKNVETLGVTDCTRVVVADTFAWVRSALTGELANRREPWLVFCCPPYEYYVSRDQQLLQMLEEIAAVAPPASTIVVECDRRFDTNRLPATLSWDIRQYPPAVIAIGRKQ